MDVYTTELGIRLSCVKTSEFREGGVEPPIPPRYATGGPPFDYAQEFALQLRKITESFSLGSRRVLSTVHPVDFDRLVMDTTDGLLISILLATGDFWSSIGRGECLPSSPHQQTLVEMIG
jgi:hypothetical protein